MKFLKDYQARQWLYGIATAVLILLSGYGVISAQERENIVGVVVAVLNLGGAAATTLAGLNARPSERDISTEN